MAHLYIIRGLPGSGKSTLGEKLVGKENSFAADDYFMTEDGQYIFNRDDLNVAHGDCLYRVTRNLQMGRDTAVCNTFVRLWELTNYLNTAKHLGCTYSVIHVQSQFKNIHGVPQEVVERMKKNWEHY